MGGIGEATAINPTTATAPHILLVSFPGQGHINPLLRLGKRIAAKGALVTFTSTLNAGHRILNSKSLSSSPSLIPIGAGHLRFDFFPDGWPDDDPRRADINALIHQQRTFCSSALSSLIRRLSDENRPVSFIINNPFVPWALDVAADLNISCAVLWVQSCAVFSTYYHYYHSLAEFPSESNPTTAVTLPGLPDLGPDDLPSFLLPSNTYTALTEIILSQFSNMKKARWVFANSFDALEPGAIRALAQHVEMVPVGPLVRDESTEVRGDMWEAAEDCIEWLDAQESRAVLYVSVGSVVVLSDAEMAEIGHGLLGCGRPFLWVVRESSRGSLPEGFLEEVKVGGKGKVVGWAPQEGVLGHGAVGCFVTHCGWNSTLEALAAGLPVVAFPQWGDQVTNAKFLVDEYGVGVRLGKPVTREAVAERVSEVFEGERAATMLERAARLKEAARVAVAPGGSSDRNVEAFLEEVVRGKGCGDSFAALETI